MTNLEKFNNAFCDALNVEVSELEGLKYKGVPNWDSVGHMMLVSNLSQVFSIEMSFEDVASLQSYEEAKKIISSLRSELRCDELVKVLRKAQKYTVGLFEQTEKKLKDAHALELLSCGVYVLEERFYDHDSGILLEGKPMDLLMF